MMDRRHFLKTAMVTGAALTLSDALNPLSGYLHAADRADLVVVRGPSPAGIARAAVDNLGGMRRFVSRGDVVVVKPNMCWDRTPEYAATTNPEVVSTIVRLCYEAGAKKVKVFDHTVSDPRRCYKQSGIADAAGVAGAAVSYVDDRKFREVKLGGHALKSWPIYTEILEADKVINVPIAKTHGLTTLTLGMKNWMGVMGGSRGRIHQRIEGSIVDVALLIRPALIVLDAVRILTANGPGGGDLSDVKRANTVVAGTDQVAVDAYGATLFGMKGADIGHIVAAHRAGLGTMDISRLKIKRINL
jgi:uncharacterized protein (DUF362 family)